MSAVAQIAAQAAAQAVTLAAGQGGGAPSALAGFRPGQVLPAQVLGAGEGGTTRIAIGTQQLDVVLPRPAEAGAALRFQVQGQGAEAKLLLLPNAQGASAGAAAPAPQPPATPGSAVALIARGVPEGPVREALLQVARASIARQDSLAPLFASLAMLQGRPVALPDGVTAAIT